MLKWIEFVGWSLKLGNPCDKEALLSCILDRLENCDDDAWFIPSLECLADYLETGRAVRLQQALAFAVEPGPSNSVALAA